MHDPDVVITHSGGATIPGHDPIIMGVADTLRVIEAAPGLVVIDTRSDERLLGWEQLDVDELAFSATDNHLELSELALSAPYGRLRIAEDQARAAGAGVVKVDRQVVKLAPKEFALLIYLYENRGQVCRIDRQTGVQLERRSVHARGYVPAPIFELADRAATDDQHVNQQRAHNEHEHRSPGRAPYKFNQLSHG